MSADFSISFLPAAALAGINIILATTRYRPSTAALPAQRRPQAANRSPEGGCSAASAAPVAAARSGRGPKRPVVSGVCGGRTSGDGGLRLKPSTSLRFLAAPLTASASPGSQDGTKRTSGVLGGAVEGVRLYPTHGLGGSITLAESCKTM